jgi:enamine deaminase RidA (YjgF/YER057c/UK114 family)
MTVELLNPAGLPQPEFYRQMAVATGTRTVYLAGQVARTADGEQVGPGDLAAQVEQAYLNIATALAAVGGSFDDVAKLTVYIVDWSEEMLPALGEGVGRAGARLGVDPIKPVTLLSVGALGEPDLLVEVDAVAVLD